MTDPINLEAGEAVAWGVIWPGAPDPAPGRFHYVTVFKSEADKWADDEGAIIVPLAAAPPPPVGPLVGAGDGETRVVMGPTVVHKAPAVSVEEVAQIIRDECFEVRDGELQGSAEAATRIIARFKEKSTLIPLQTPLDISPKVC